MRSLVLAAAVLAALTAPVLGQTTPAPATDPAIQALGQMLQEAQGREAQALARAYRAEAQAKAEHDRADAEKRRADDAEARLPKADPPK